MTLCIDESIIIIGIIIIIIIIIAIIIIIISYLFFVATKYKREILYHLIVYDP